MDFLSSAFSFLGSAASDFFGGGGGSELGFAAGDLGTTAADFAAASGGFDWLGIGKTLLGAGAKAGLGMLSGGGGSNKMAALPSPRAVSLPGGDIPTGYKGIPDAGKNKAVQSQDPRGMYTQWQAFMRQFAYEGK